MAVAVRPVVPEEGRGERRGEHLHAGHVLVEKCVVPVVRGFMRADEELESFLAQEVGTHVGAEEHARAPALVEARGALTLDRSDAALRQ
jgi:hypothetical protein